MKKIDKIFFSKCINAIKERILFFNIRNSNVRSMAYSELCYKKLKRKFKKELIRENYNIENNSNYIWICWFQGMELAPELVKTCYNSVKQVFQKYSIIVITEDNYKEYVTFPKYIEKKKEKGVISYAQFSDLLRLELLTTYGGIWIDSTVFVSNKPKFLENDIPLFVFKNISLYKKQDLAVVASSWFMKSNKGEPIIKLTKRLIYKYWKKYNRLIIYNLVHILFTLATEVYNDEWKAVPTYSNIPPHILQFELLNKYDEKRFNEMIKMSDIHKLNHRLKTSNKNSNYHYILNNGVRNEKDN